MFEIPSDTPKYIQSLPREERGFPIPWFVATLPDGSRDLRFADYRKKVASVKNLVCWVCGKPLNIMRVLVGGPLSFFNGRYGDMHCHPSCAEFSAKYCPHLNNTKSKYRIANSPDGVQSSEGLTMSHPGVIGLVYCLDTDTCPTHDDLLLSPVDVQKVEWWHKGAKISAREACELWTPPPDIAEAYPEMMPLVKEKIRNSQ